ncbi:hypothetical protein ACFL2U_00430 [Patescibacteria group bacterium]
MNKFEQTPEAEEQKDENEKKPFSPEDSVPRSKGPKGKRKFEVPENQ